MRSRSHHDTAPSYAATTRVPQVTAASIPAGSTADLEPVASPDTQLLLGRYRVVETRGTGGFGCVLVCWDTRLQRRVAIKRMPLATADPYGANPLPAGASSIEEVLSEARTASMLSHPNIVTVLDLEVEDTYAFLVMEYVDGITLAELLARVEGGTLTYDECAHVLSSLGSALSFAHENGVLHLDIKPANVFIDRSGTVKLGDFGMAALASAAGYGSGRGGTVGYMPPEQLTGSTVDERSDIYSLAVVCYQALTGRDPFAAQDAQESADLEVAGAAPLSEMDPDLAGPVSDAIAIALDPSPRGRMVHVDDLTREVVPALGDPGAGRDSIASLMGQVTDDETYDESWREFEREPLANRVPWLSAAFCRILTAVACGWCAMLVVPALGIPGHIVIAGTTLSTTVVGAILCAGAGALVPWLGSALVLVGVSCALGLSPTAGSAPGLVVAVAVAASAWWLLIGRRHHYATVSLLLPACCGIPEAGCALGGWALRPVSALVTTTFGWLFSRLLSTFVSSGFDTATTASTMMGLLSAPETWILAVGCGLASCLVSAISHRNTVPSAILGQVLGGCALVGVSLVATRVENGGIWGVPSWGQLGLALLFSLLMVVVTVLMGPSASGQESD